MDETGKKRRGLSPVAALRALNAVRQERGLPPVRGASNSLMTSEKVRAIAIEVWKKYPQALTDPNYQLGELTLALVQQEIDQKVSDARRGIVVKQAALKDYFN